MAHNPDQFQHRGADGRLGEARLPPGMRATAPTPPAAALPDGPPVVAWAVGHTSTPIYEFDRAGDARADELVQEVIDGTGDVGYDDDFDLEQTARRIVDQVLADGGALYDRETHASACAAITRALTVYTTAGDDPRLARIDRRPVLRQVRVAPEGMVLVETVPAGSGQGYDVPRRAFLVPADEYDKRPGFTVDEARHEEVRAPQW